MGTVLISFISEQAIPNVMAPLLAEPRPDVIKCILPTDPRDPTRKDSRFVGVYQGVQAALGELGFSKVRDRGPVSPYNFEEVKGVCEKIRQEHPGATFIYNITGGTKLMAQAAITDAEMIQAKAIYVDTENNRLITLEGDNATSELYSLQRLQEITVARYFQAYGVEARGGIAESPPDPWLAAARTVATAEGGPTLMRSLVRFSEPKTVTHSEINWDVADLSKPEREALEHLVGATSSIGAHLYEDRFTWPVTKESKDFIWRRHWLEWYTFDCLKKVADEDPAWHQPLRNVRVIWPGWDRLISYINELDVTTIRDGRLLICECKAGDNAPTSENIYKLHVMGYKMGTFANKVFVTATPNLTEPGKRQREDQVIRALALDILLVGADTLPMLSTYLKDFDDWLYEQQVWFNLRRRQ